MSALRCLAYIAAFAPDAGALVAAMFEAPLPSGQSAPPVLPPRDGYVIVDPARFPAAFAADVPLPTTRFMAAAQVPWGVGALQAQITKVAWKVQPASYMVATADLMIPPSAQRFIPLPRRAVGRAM